MDQSKWSTYKQKRQAVHASAVGDGGDGGRVVGEPSDLSWIRISLSLPLKLKACWTKTKKNDKILALKVVTETTNTTVEATTPLTATETTTSTAIETIWTAIETIWTAIETATSSAIESTTSTATETQLQQQQRLHQQQQKQQQQQQHQKRRRDCRVSGTDFKSNSNF